MTIHTRAALIALFVFLISAPAAWSTADGPDYLRVVDVSPGQRLHLRAAPDLAAPIVGRIPATTDGLRNLGCRGGLTFAEYQSASPAEREAGKRTRWCRVGHDGAVGWAAGWHLAEGEAPAHPIFDCSRAESGAEKAVCEDGDLAALDRELDRLYRLAIDGPHMTEERAHTLRAYQRGWIKGRDDCWKAGEGLRACVADAYVMRIHRLRAEYADARADDGSGISIGPLAYACDGFDALVSAVFVNAPRGYLSLRWRDWWQTLERVRAASGSRYVGPATGGGESVFWIKGDEATWDRPGEAPLHCRVEETG